MKSPIPERANRFYKRGPDGYPRIRLYHRKRRGKKGPRYLLKCGCCGEKVEIYYDKESLEINGVLGSVADWREILLPLLGRSTRAR
jgi:hypothetical protein